MKTKRFSTIGVSIVTALSFILTLWQVCASQAFEPGKTYDSSNWEEIKDIVFPQMLNWVKDGEFILLTRRLITRQTGWILLCNVHGKN